MREKYISLAKFNVLEALIKSLMLTKKKRGPEIEPWGTPQETQFFNKRWPLNWTYCILYEK